MDFEYDQDKSDSNKEKHGLNFVEAQELWQDSNLVHMSARIEDEVRFLIIGKIQNRHWSAVITYREQCVRIISVRRARTKEVELYESKRI